jgi:hypothetical protein
MDSNQPREPASRLGTVRPYRSAIQAARDRHTVCTYSPGRPPRPQHGDAAMRLLYVDAPRSFGTATAGFFAFRPMGDRFQETRLLHFFDRSAAGRTLTFGNGVSAAPYLRNIVPPVRTPPIPRISGLLAAADRDGMKIANSTSTVIWGDAPRGRQRGG